MSEQVAFSVTNHHAPEAGTPPRADGESGSLYRGYFENEYGEQAIFVYDRDAGKGTVYLGDAGWENPYDVLDGVAPELEMTPAERAWLMACWRAARGFQPNSG